MDTFLKTRKPIVLKEVDSESSATNITTESYTSLLDSRKPIIIKEIKYNSSIDDSNLRRAGPYTIIAPLNTDLRWDRVLPLYPRTRIERFSSTPTSAAVATIAVDDSDINSSSEEIIIPPLNTDIRFSEILPKHDPYMEANPAFIEDHPHRLHVHEQNDENFSWNTITAHDDDDLIRKKKLINPIQSQHMCGSCWAMAMAAAISDCFVVSGAVDWMPRIAPTYLMMVIPSNSGNSQCEGGNPASVALALESIPVCDTSCIDYSWCTNDTELCTSSSAANHFKSTFGQRLNNNIPKPPDGSGGACYFPSKKYAYEIDKGSDVFFINNDAPTETFRDMVKAHIVDFGPTIAGYAVLKNFVTGNFTDPSINEGVYFDRADYSSVEPGKLLKFSDSNAKESQLSGLHAVRVLGWGVAKNIQYDNDKFGDVPYWVAANSWNSNWGNMGGAFRMAMYPYNKYAQFDAQISVRGFRVGGMILVRCTKKPEIVDQQAIAATFLRKIKRVQPDNYYQMSPNDISGKKDEAVDDKKRKPHTNGHTPPEIQPVSSSSSSSYSTWIYVAVGVAIIAIILYIVLRR